MTKPFSIYNNNSTLKREEEEGEQGKQLVSTWLGLEAVVVYLIFNSISICNFFVKFFITLFDFFQ